MQETIKVAAAVIINSQDETLVSLRLANSHQGGKWEFPGGKFEQNETAEQALIRELQEELGISIQQTEPFLNFQYAYPDKTVYLHVLKVLSYTGEPKGLEGQQVEWVSGEKLKTLEFPEANYAILDKLLKLL